MIEQDRPEIAVIKRSSEPPYAVEGIAFAEILEVGPQMPNGQSMVKFQFVEGTIVGDNVNAEIYKIMNEGDIYFLSEN